MPTNKNALIRYKVLDSCFRNTGKKYYINDLIEACEKVILEINPDSSGISRRQILYDINFMESAEGWEIELERHREENKQMYYRYSDPSFSINNMPLNEVEINHLKGAIDILSQFKGMPQFEWINELVPKLQLGITPSNSAPAIIEFDSNQYLKGIEYLGTLHNAIFYKKVLSISYKPYENNAPYDVIIHPYFLKQYNNRWFLFGYNSGNEKYDWNLALDRIVDIRETLSSYHENSAIDWEEYFEDMIGVTKPTDARIENVVLHFFGKTGNYVETKPLHGSQKEKRIDENTLEISLDLIINYELERLVLSYAESVEVIKPLALLTSVKERLDLALKYYKFT